LKTYSTKRTDIKREWQVIDASGKTLGRLASQVASLLMGKHKPIFSPNTDTGDYVIVINAAKVRATGKKLKQKIYYRHSGYHGGLKSTTLEELMRTNPARAVEHAVNGMLPHTRLGDMMRKRLRVYAGDTYPHPAQKKATEAEGKDT